MRPYCHHITIKVFKNFILLYHKHLIISTLINKTIKDGDIAPWKDFKKIEQRKKKRTQK